MKKIIKMHEKIGDFGENKDTARELRIKKVMTSLQDGNEIIFDFDKVTGVTQSFIHSLISEPIREFQDIALEKMIFKNCNDNVKKIVQTVYEYMQESIDKP
jgi:hypothetical protein